MIHFLPSDFIRTKISGTIVNQFVDVSVKENGASEPDQGDTEIDESKSGQPWVQGLTEGEYSDLSVEERLRALVALVGIANEGNSIRSILEVTSFVFGYVNC